MGDGIVIEELSIPASPAAPSFADFDRALAVRNAHEAHVMGPAARSIDPVEMLPLLLDQTHLRQRIFVGRLHGEIVAQALLQWSTGAGTRVAWAFGEVLPTARRRGVGTALFDHVEGIAQAAGRPVIQSFAMHEAIAGGDRLSSPSGFGSVSLDDPGVRFLSRRGYQLSQVQRLSLLTLPVPAARLDALHRKATAAGGDTWAIVTWQGPTPEHWLADVAVLFSRMETDAPRGSLVNEPEEWDVDRTRDHEAQRARSGQLSLTAAAVHQPTGRLAGFTRLAVPTDRRQPVRQQETLVLREHRGHRLGLLMKLANLRQLTQASPVSTLVVSGNAEDNVHMLAINEAIGFIPIAWEGAWTKSLA